MTRPTTITSVQNPRVKATVRLRDGRGRQRAGRIVIDGLREIERARGAGFAIEELFACRDLLDTDGHQVLAELRTAGVSVFEVVPAVFERLAFGARGEGLVAVAATPRRTLAEFQPRAGAPLAVLVGVEKPGNVGAVLRSADGAGLGGVIVCDAGTDLFNPNAIRSSLGTVFTLPLAAATSDAALAWLGERRIPLVLTLPDAADLYTQADLATPAAIVLGAESTGLPAIWQRSAGRAVRLPMLGAADSLNVSAAAAVLFYESLRQRS